MEQDKVSPYDIKGTASKRTLHFFWLLDVSGSMLGKKIETLNWAIKEIIPELENIEDTERIEIKMRVIAFDEKAWWHVGPEPVSLKDFLNKWQDLKAGSITETHLAINMLTDALSIENMGKRNIPPVAILISDGYCTSDDGEYKKSIDRLNSITWGKKAVRISIGISSANSTEYDYNKDELDMFISPYLRNQNDPVETLHSDNPQKLIQYIRTASVTATISASKSNTNDEKSDKPVNISASDLDYSINDLDSKEANDVF